MVDHSILIDRLLVKAFWYSTKLVQVLTKRQTILCLLVTAYLSEQKWYVRFPKDQLLGLQPLQPLYAPTEILKNNNIAYHNYADDTQMYISLSTGDYGRIDSLIKCIERINAWMCHKRKTKKLNAYIEYLSLKTKPRLTKFEI